MTYSKLLNAAILMVVSFTATASAQLSSMNNDPEVVYLEEHLDRKVELLTVSDTTVYSDKKANHRLGVYRADTKLQLIALSKYAYKVKGQATHSIVNGWVNPKLLASKDKDFIANFKKLYERQLIVKELVANNDVAIGMTLKEVAMSLGEPTETEVKQTREGESGQWEYIEREEQKHYKTVVDPQTGQIFRQVSHTTVEEKSRTTLEFESNVVTSITRKKNNGAGNSKIIPTPVVLHF